MIRKHGAILIGAVALFLAGWTFAVEPQREPVRFDGRIGTSSEGRPEMYWPGTSIDAVFEGTSLAVVLNDETGKPYYNVVIDGNDTSPVVLDMDAGRHTYTVASNLTAGTHSVKLFRRTEGTDGPTEFCGFILDDKASLKVPLPVPTRRIEFYGDSITCGMGNEALDNAGDKDNADRNNYLAYGAMTARALEADYRCIARSGIGVLISWYDLVMPDYWNRLDPQDEESRWDFSKWTPDVVVVNLFQNDSWLVRKMDPEPTKKEIVQAYIDFVSGIRNVYPDAHIVCALGCMNATQQGSPWPGYIHEAVQKMHDPNMSELVFPYTGFAKHPRVRHHRAMAEQLTAHIRKVMEW